MIIHGMTAVVFQPSFGCTRSSTIHPFVQFFLTKNTDSGTGKEKTIVGERHLIFKMVAPHLLQDQLVRKSKRRE